MLFVSYSYKCIHNYECHSLQFKDAFRATLEMINHLLYQYQFLIVMEIALISIIMKGHTTIDSFSYRIFHPLKANCLNWYFHQTLDNFAITNFSWFRYTIIRIILIHLFAMHFIFRSCDTFKFDIPQSSVIIIYHFDFMLNSLKALRSTLLYFFAIINVLSYLILRTDYKN